MQATTRRAAAAAARPLGIIRCIVAVTNHQDQVGDIIAPGAFKDTLAKRRAKLCWMHDWKDPLGSVLAIEEMRPGDSRLPTLLPDGRPFPAGAGAVIATVKFNLNTIRGREMYAHAKEWAKTGEAAFSIGYKVVPGGSANRADGVRIIYKLDLFEVSLVLHGAHDMALALEVKGITGGEFEGLEFKDAGGVVDTDGSQNLDGSMVALFLDPQTAKMIAVPEGLPPEELHVTVLYLGDMLAVDDPDKLVAALTEALKNTAPLSGTIGGLGTFPADDAPPVWVPVDVAGLNDVYTTVRDACAAAGTPNASEHGYTPHVTLGYGVDGVEPVGSTPVTFDQLTLAVGGQRYPIPLGGKAAATAPVEGKALDSNTAAMIRSWVDGKMAAQIGWGTGGDFDRCVVLATEHMTEEQAKGFCNLRHHDALGIYPATHAAADRGLEGKGLRKHKHKLPKHEKCAYCKRWAQHRVIHSEGMGYIPTCPTHLDQAKDAAASSTPDGTPDPSNINTVRDIPTPLEGKAHDAVLEARSENALLEGKSALSALYDARKSGPSTPPRTLMEGTETKMFTKMAGSDEEKREALREELNELFRKPFKDGKKSGKDGKAPEAPGGTMPSVCIEATFPDRVIITVYGSGYDEDETYQVPYTWDGTDPELGVPVPVQLSVVATPDAGDDDEEDPNAAAIEGAQAANVRHVAPVIAALADAASRINAVPAGLEVKDAFDGLEDPLLSLLDALAVKGYDVAKAVLGDDEEEEGDGTDAADSPDDEGMDQADNYDPKDPNPNTATTADPEDAADGGSDEAAEGDAEDATDGGSDEATEGDAPTDEDAADGGSDDATEVDGRVKLDPEEVKRQLAALKA